MKKWAYSLVLLLLAGCGNEKNADSSSLPESAHSAEDSSGQEVPAVQDENRISFLAVGDNLIHRQIYEEMETADGYNFKPLYTAVAEDIQQADLAFVNQESILGGDDLGFSTYPAFNTPSQMAGDLADLGFNLVSLANNHTLDKGTQGVLNTLEIWDKQSDRVLSTGAFNSQEERDAIPLITVKGVTFSFLAYTYGTNGIKADTPYRLNYFTEERVKEDLRRAKEQSDMVIVSAHWGEEYGQEPTDYQKHYAQLLADEGADIIIGNHSHTIQPIEWIEGKEGTQTLVTYSLGNFIASTPNDVSLLGGMLTFDIQKPDLTIENVHFEPLVIQYEATDPSEILTRHHFSVNKLDEYTEEQARKHGMNGYEGHDVSIDRFHQWVEEIIDPQFRK